MIAFASLFLGLILGNQPIELVVEGDVVSVRVELDGREVATLRGEPWEGEVDLGPDLHPHLLEATALGSGGAVLGRTRQWVNLPREPAEASLVLEGVDPTRPDRARLVWQHIEYAAAEAITASLDGTALAVGPGGEIALPAYDPTKLHLLSAELRFDDGARYRAEVGFGGSAGTVLDTELTGVAIRAAGSPPKVDALASSLLRDGEALRPVAVEKSPAKVVMVVDQGAIAPLRQLAGRGDIPETSSTRVKTGEEVSFVFPAVEIVPRRDVPTRLFDMSQPFTRRDGSFAFLLSHVVPPSAQQPYQRLTDAVAVAGLQAAAGARPRAVVLVLGPQPRDESAYGIAEVLRYLEELRVPLLVWSTGRPSARTVSEDRRPLAMKTPWGKAADVGSLNRFLRAIEGLREVLDHQCTVWVEGSHLPSRITLAPAVKGLQLAGVDGSPP